MKKNLKDGVEFYTFNIFDNLNLKHCFTTKIGGVSEGTTATLNLAFRKKDSDEIVLENYKRVCDAVGLSYEGIVIPKQQHTNNIKIIDRSEIGLLNNNSLDNTDGIMTNEKGIVLTTLYADCVPLYFYDKKKHVIALSHSGWRGTVKKISVVTVNKMVKDFGSNVKDILVGIGPSIGQCCFEVDESTKIEFEQNINFANDYIYECKSNNKFYIDMQGINKQLLLEIGLLESNIEIANLCTKCNSDTFYSHRVMGADRGCMAAMIELL